MSKIQLTAYERETIILTNDEDKHWDIYTCQGKIMTKLKKIGAEPYDVVKDEEGRVIEARYRLDYKQVSFRKLIELSSERKEELAERLKKSRKEHQR